MTRPILADPSPIALALARWFRAHARDLPWRVRGRSGTRREPYMSLVSEAMLQQTQVSRVVPKFDAFLARFPTPAALAAAPIDDVLAAWTGLGYYRRARNLQAAARAIVDLHGGDVPDNAEALRALPGVGKYTAGAIASLAFERPVPLVDVNAARVLLRVGGKRLEPKRGEAWAWQAATNLALAAGEQVGDCNEGLMELGARVCTPKAPACHACPLATWCLASRRGWQERIPARQAKAPRSSLTHVVLWIECEGRVLVERRSEQGLWAGMDQLLTAEGTGNDASAIVRSRHDLAPCVRLSRSNPLMDFVFNTTHRAVRHLVVRATLGKEPQHARWLALDEALVRAMASPQRRILRTLAAPSPSPR